MTPETVKLNDAIKLLHYAIAHFEKLLDSLSVHPELAINTKEPLNELKQGIEKIMNY